MLDGPARLGLAAALVSLLACGDGGRGQGDAGGAMDAAGDRDANLADAAAAPRCPAAPHAQFDVSASPEAGFFTGSYSDVAWPTTVEEKVRAGECAFFGPEPPFCDPACGGEAICATGGVCRGFPVAMDVGTVRVAGTDPALDLEPNQFNQYYTQANLPALYQPGDELVLTIEGRGAVASLDLTVRGVPALEPPTGPITAREHEDMVVTWTPDPSSPEGAEIVLHADNDHHGIVAYVECRATDDGELVVPAEVLDPLILAGETGIGTYIENAWMARIDEATADTDLGCASLRSLSQVPIQIETVRAE
jgi:hypothetical protein